MIETAAHESRRRMAKVAIQSSRHMIRRLAPGRHPMAELTAIHEAGVIENCTGESAGAMAYAAILIGNDMPGSLASGKHTVVTRLTIVNDASVIKGRRQESGRQVALAAVRIGRHVIARLATGRAAIVA